MSLRPLHAAIMLLAAAAFLAEVSATAAAAVPPAAQVRQLRGLDDPEIRAALGPVRAVFVKACANCHVHGDSGGQLGPNLTDDWMNGPDDFVENLVDPNGVVGPDYQLTKVITDDGWSISGIIAEETPDLLVLRTPDGPVTVPVAVIEERTTSAVSLMPSGILENLPENEFLVLVKFLSTKP